MLSIVVAIDSNGLIGNHMNLPWHLPEDLKYFRNLTIGKTVVMGRKTYESIGKPLSNRKNIILTRDLNYQAEGCKVINNKNELRHEGEDVFIIGGSEIFNLFLNDVNQMFVTHIDFSFEGNIYFPKIDLSLWEEISRKQGITDNNNIYSYYFSIYKKKQVIKNKYRYIYWSDEL